MELMVGDKSGGLTILHKAGVTSHRCIIWSCRCDCGERVLVRSQEFRRGQVCFACGVKKRALSATRHGACVTRLYNIWLKMRERCRVPICRQWRWYGAKGITVCAEWHDFITFREWANANGYSDSLTIERKDSEGNYEPSNCEWIPQAENTRRAAMHRRVKSEKQLMRGA